MSVVEVLENEIAALRKQLKAKLCVLTALKRSSANEAAKRQVAQKLTNDEISRYSRQIILPEVGVRGQLALKNASILIVGAGGLGIFWLAHIFVSVKHFNSFFIGSQVVHRHCICVVLVSVALASLTTIRSN